MPTRLPIILSWMTPFAAVMVIVCARNVDAQELPVSFRSVNSVGQAPGNGDKGFSQIRMFAPFGSQTNSTWFADLGVGAAYTGAVQSNIGIGHRFAFSDASQNILGLSAWYDLDDGNRSLFHQGGLNLEIQGNGWLVSSNVYVPFGNTNPVVQSYTAPLGTHQGNFVIVSGEGDTYQTVEDAFGGFDIEFGGDLPFIGTDLGVRGYVGYYRFTAENQPVVNGVQTRVEVDVTENIFTDVRLTSDNTFGTNVTFGLTWDLPYGGSSPSRRANAPLSDRLRRPIRRNSRVVVAERQVRIPGNVEVLRLASGTAARFVHVNSQAADGGDGSIEAPLRSVDRVFANSKEGDFIVLAQGSELHGQGLVLKPNQTVIVDGMGHQVTTASGMSIVPQAHASAAGRPVIRNSPTHGITLASGSSVMGVDIENSAGAAIFGDGASGGMSLVKDVQVMGGATGVQIQNSSDSKFTFEDTPISGAKSGVLLANNPNSTFTFDDFELTATDGTGLMAKNSGTVEFMTNPKVKSVGGPAIDLENTRLKTNGMFGVTFDELEATSSKGDGIRLSSIVDPVNVPNGTLVNGAGGRGIVVENSSADMNFGKTGVSGTVDDAVQLTNNTGQIRFENLDITTSGGDGLVAMDSGTVVLDGDLPSIVAEGGAALDIEDTRLITNGVMEGRFGDLVSNNSARQGIRLVGTKDPITATKGVTVTNPTGPGVELERLGADVNLMMAAITGNKGPALLLMNNSADPANPVKVSVENLEIASNGGAGIKADNGGTLDFTGSKNPLVETVGGPALDIADTRLLRNGMSGVTFDKLDSTDSDADGVRLIGIKDPIVAANGTNILNPQGKGILVQGTTADIDFMDTKLMGSKDDALALQDNTGKVTVGGLEVDTNGGGGIVADNGGTLNFTGDMPKVKATGGPALDISGTKLTTNDMSGVTFDSLASTDSDAEGIKLQGVTDPIKVADGTTVSGSARAGIMVADTNLPNATDVIDFGKTKVSGTKGDGISVSNTMQGKIEFDDLDVSTDDGGGIVAKNGGTLNLKGADPKVNATGGPALDLTNTDLERDGMAGLSIFGTLASTDSDREGLVLDGINDNISVPNGTTIRNPAGDAAVVRNSSADVDLGDTLIADAGSGTGEDTDGDGNTAGDDDDGGDGLKLQNNTGTTTVRNPTITTKGGAGILADNGGTLNVVGTAKVDATGGPALDLKNTELQTNGVPNSGLIVSGPLKSTGSKTDGVNLDNIDDPVTARDGTEVKDSKGDGVVVKNSSANVDLGKTKVDGSGGDGLKLENNTGTTKVADLDVNSKGTGIKADQGGTLNVTGDNPKVTATGGPAVDLKDTRLQTNGMSGITFNGPLKSTGSATDGLKLEKIQDPVSVPDGTTVTDSTGDGIVIKDTTAPVDLGKTTISGTGGDGLKLLNNEDTAGNPTKITAKDLDIETKDGGGIVASKGGTLNTTGEKPKVKATGGPALDITDTELETNGVAESGLTIQGGLTSTNSKTDGVKLDNINDPVKSEDGTTVTNAAGKGISLTNLKPNADVDLGPTTVDGTGDDAVVLKDNPGTTTTLKDLKVTTADANGIVADNAGTVNFTGDPPVINVTGGSPLNIKNTMLQSNGSPGLMIDSITATGSMTDAVVLDNVDTPVTIDSLSVMGSMGTGLTIMNADADVTIGSASLMDIAGTGVMLKDNTGKVSLGNLAITTTAGAGLVADSGGAPVLFTGDAPTISAMGGAALDVVSTQLKSQVATGVASDNVTFKDLMSENSSDNGVRLENVLNNVNLSVTDGTTIKTPAEHGIVVKVQAGTTIMANFGPTSITGTGTADMMVGDGIRIEDGNGSTFAFTDLTVTTENGSGIAMVDGAAMSAGGTLQLRSTTSANLPSVTAMSGPVLDLKNARLQSAIGTAAFADGGMFGTLKSEMSPSVGLRFDGLQNAVTVTESTTITDPVGSAIVVLDTMQTLNFGETKAEMAGTADGTAGAAVFIKNATETHFSGLVASSDNGPGLLVVDGGTLFLDTDVDAVVSGTGGAAIDLRNTIVRSQRDTGTVNNVMFKTLTSKGSRITTDAALINGATTSDLFLGHGIHLDNVTNPIIVLDKTEITGSASDGVVLKNSADISFNELAVTTTNGRAIFGTASAPNLKIGSQSGDIKSTGFTAIDLNNAELDMVLSTVVAQNSSAAGLKLQNVSGDFSVTAETTVKETVGEGVLIQNSSANISFDKLDITTNGGIGLFVRDSTGKVKSSDGTISSTGFTAINLTNANSGLTLKDIKSSNSDFSGVIFSNLSGTFFAEGTTTITNSEEQGLSATGSSANIIFETFNVETVQKEAILLDGQTGTFTINGGLINGAKGTTVRINGGDKDTTIGSKMTNITGKSIELTNRSGGAVTFKNSITDVGDGVYIHDNTAGLIAFTEQMDLDTGDHVALEMRNNLGFEMSFSNLDIHTTSGVGMFIYNGGNVVSPRGSVAEIISTNAPALMVNVPTLGTTPTIPAEVTMNVLFKNITSGARQLLNTNMPTNDDTPEIKYIDAGQLGLNVAANGRVDLDSAAIDLRRFGGTVSVLGTVDLDTQSVHAIKVVNGSRSSRVTIAKSALNVSGVLPSNESGAVLIEDSLGDFAINEGSIVGTFDYAVIVSGAPSNTTDSTATTTIGKVISSSGAKGGILGRDLEDGESLNVIDSEFSGLASEWVGINLERIFSNGTYNFTGNKITGNSGKRQVGIKFQSQVTTMVPTLNIANNEIVLNPNPPLSYEDADDTAVGIHILAGGSVTGSGGGNKAVKEVNDKDAEDADVFGVTEMKALKEALKDEIGGVNVKVNGN